jgi:hypothetical protein
LPTRIQYAFSLLPHVCYMLCPSHPPWHGHSNYTWRYVLVWHCKTWVWVCTLFQPGPSGSPETVEVNESIISLLLKLHSLLSGTPDSYNPDDSSGNSSAPQSPDSRIGDGPHFIGMLLQRISALDPLCK